jgi:hypothetical protein
LVVLALLWREQLRWVTGLSIAWLLAYLFVVGPLYRYLEVRPIGRYFALQTQVHQVAAMVRHNAVVAPEDRAFLGRIQPLASWSGRYYCYSLSPVVYNEQVALPFFEANADIFVQTWERLAQARPDVLIGHLLCVNSLVWRVTMPADAYIDGPQSDILENDLGLRSASMLPDFKARIVAFVDRSFAPQRVWWTWRPALYLYLALFAGAVAAIRLGDARALAALTPLVLNSLVLLLLITVQDFRFQYPVYVTGLAASALLFARP